MIHRQIDNSQIQKWLRISFPIADATCVQAFTALIGSRKLTNTITHTRRDSKKQDSALHSVAGQPALQNSKRGLTTDSRLLSSPGEVRLLDSKVMQFGKAREAARSPSQ